MTNRVAASKVRAPIVQIVNPVNQEPIAQCVNRVQIVRCVNRENRVYRVNQEPIANRFLQPQRCQSDRLLNVLSQSVYTALRFLLHCQSNNGQLPNEHWLAVWQQFAMQSKNRTPSSEKKANQRSKPTVWFLWLQTFYRSCVWLNGSTRPRLQNSRSNYLTCAIFAQLLQAVMTRWSCATRQLVSWRAN